jgi:hypothetical protein
MPFIREYHFMYHIYQPERESNLFSIVALFVRKQARVKSMGSTEQNYGLCCVLGSSIVLMWLQVLLLHVHGGDADTGTCLDRTMRILEQAPERARDEN